MTTDQRYLDSLFKIQTISGGMKMMVVKTQKPIPKYSKSSCRKMSRRLELPSPCAGMAGKEGLEFLQMQANSVLNWQLWCQIWVTRHIYDIVGVSGCLKCFKKSAHVCKSISQNSFPDEFPFMDLWLIWHHYFIQFLNLFKSLTKFKMMRLPKAAAIKVIPPIT